jgi:hypothetical protein
MSVEWQEILAHSEEMRAAARGGAFEQVAMLELSRRKLLEAVPKATQETQHLVEAMVSCELETAGLVEAARNDAAAMLRNLRHVQAGTGAYLDVCARR